VGIPKGENVRGEGVPISRTVLKLFCPYRCIYGVLGIFSCCTVRGGVFGGVIGGVFGGVIGGVIGGEYCAASKLLTVLRYISSFSK
jgi:uncharacterized membrane protein